MIDKTRTLTIPPACWVPGEPTEPGYHLIRMVSWGRLWVYLFECTKFEDMGDRWIYSDGTGGNTQYDLAMKVHGEVTHHCAPTPENFTLALAEIQENQQLNRPQEIKAQDPTL